MFFFNNFCTFGFLLKTPERKTFYDSDKEKKQQKAINLNFIYNLLIYSPHLPKSCDGKSRERIISGRKLQKNKLLKSSRETNPLGTDSIREIPENPLILTKLSSS